MTPGQQFPCLFCLAPAGEGMSVRLDKKHGRPFMSCRSCNVKIFVQVHASWRGPERLWGALRLALVQNDAEAGKVLIGKAVDNAAVEQPAA